MPSNDHSSQLGSGLGHGPGPGPSYNPGYGYGYGYGYDPARRYSYDYEYGHADGPGPRPGTGTGTGSRRGDAVSPRITILDLPREVIRLIALKIYDPLELTQQDRLTWGIFSTVDMHQERQDDLADLINLGMVSRKIRREVRRILFSCVRVPSVDHAMEVVRNREGWARYVKSIIIDLNMFDLDDNASTRPRLSPSNIDIDIDVNQNHSQGQELYPPSSVGRRGSTYTSDPSKKPRSCWAESSLLTSLLNSLPSLNHLSFFADASDDSTLALLFASLIPHPSLHAVPPTVLSNSPSAFSTVSTLHSNPNANANAGANHIATGYQTFIPLTHRLKSFGWRQRAPPPNQFRQFSQSSTFVSTLHLVRHAHNLSFLVLDADMDEMTKRDVLAVVKELSLRRSPMGEQPNKLSLMLCGPINGWQQSDDSAQPETQGQEQSQTQAQAQERKGKAEGGFLQELTNQFGDHIKELFVDRPLEKSTKPHATSFEAFTNLLRPLESLPHLRLLQVGSYTFTPSLQAQIALHLSRAIPSLLVLGLLGEEGETAWWGVWRRASYRGLGRAHTAVSGAVGAVGPKAAVGGAGVVSDFGSELELRRIQSEPQGGYQAGWQWSDETGTGRGGQGNIVQIEGQDRDLYLDLDLGVYDDHHDIRIKYLADGDLRQLEDEVEQWIKSHPPTPPSTDPGTGTDESQGQGQGLELGGGPWAVRDRLEGDGEGPGEDVRMTPPYPSPSTARTVPTTGAGAGIGAIGKGIESEDADVYGRARALGLDLSGVGSTSRGGVEEGQGRRMMSLDRLLG